MIDDTTAEVFKEYTMPCMENIQLIRIPRPKTLLEGISYRYSFFDHVYNEEEVVFHLDIDIQCIRQFRPTLPPDTLAVFPEGSPTDTNYCGDWILDHPGLSAGFWAVRIGEKTAKIFKTIQELIKTKPGNFYTVEQVHFNAAITHTSPVVFFKPTLVSFNGITDETDVNELHFLNLAGQPGNGPVHIIQMLNCFFSML